MKGFLSIYYHLKVNILHNSYYYWMHKYLNLYVTWMTTKTYLKPMERD